MTAKSCRLSGYLPALGCMLLSSTLWAQAPRQPEPPQSCAPQVKTTVDRFSGVFQAETRVDYSADITTQASIFVGEGNDTLIVVRLTTTNSRIMYGECHPVGILVDGARLKAAPYDYDLDVYASGRVSEFITVRLTADQLRQAARATTMEGKLCNTEFVFPSWFLCDIRGLWAEYQRRAGQ